MTFVHLHCAISYRLNNDPLASIYIFFYLFCSNPTDISIDILTHDVYWVDTQEDAIYKVDYKGEQKQIIRRNTPSPRGLSILKGDIYWVDRNLENIFKASKLPKQVASPEIVKTGLQKLRDIVLVDRQNQPLDKMNPCYKSGNGNCEQLCFSYPSDEKPSITRKCECAFGSLQNGRKCAVSEEYLVFSTRTGNVSIPYAPTYRFFHCFIWHL